MQIRPPILAVFALAWLALPSVASADCDLPGPIEEELAEAQIAFVGTVTAVEGSVATFEVSELWAGEVPGLVQVYGFIGPEGPKFGRLPQPGVGPNAVAPPPVSEDDRTWQLGETYLVLPYADGGSLHDNICTATTVWGPQLEALRPEGAQILTSEQTGGAMVFALAVVALLATGSILAFRRR